MGFKDEILAVIKQAQQALNEQEKRDANNNQGINKDLNALIKEGETIKKELVGIIKDNQALESQVKELKNALQSKEIQNKQFINNIKKDFNTKLSTQKKEFNASIREKEAGFKQKLQEVKNGFQTELQGNNQALKTLQKDIKIKNQDIDNLKKQLPPQQENLTVRDAIKNSDHLSGFARIDSIAKLSRQYAIDNEYYKNSDAIEARDEAEGEKRRRERAKEKEKEKSREELEKQTGKLSKGFSDITRKLLIFGSVLLGGLGIAAYKGFQWFKDNANEYINTRYQASLAGVSFQQAKAWDSYERSKGIPQGGLLKDLQFLIQQHNLVGWSQQMLPNELLKTLGFMGVNVADFQGKPQEFYGKIIEAVQRILDEGNPRKIGMIQQQLKSSGLTGIGTAMHDAHYSGYNLIKALSYHDELVEVPKELNIAMREFIESFAELQSRFDNIKNRFLVSISDFINIGLDALNDNLLLSNDKEKSQIISQALPVMKRIIDDDTLSDEMRREKLFELAFHSVSLGDYGKTASKQWLGILNGNLAGMHLTKRELYPLALLNQALEGATSPEQRFDILDIARDAIKSWGYTKDATEQIISSLTGTYEDTRSYKYNNDIFNEEADYASKQLPATNITIHNEAGIHSQVSVDNPNNVSYNTN